MLIAASCSIVFIICTVLIGGCSAAMLRIRGAAPFLLATGVCAAAALVAGSTALSLFAAWTRTSMLVFLIALSASAVVGWSATGRVRPPSIPRHRDLARLRASTAIILVLAVAALLVQMYVGSRVAPSNWDSMTYHLSRSAYWLQYHSIAQFPGASLRQAASAPDGEVLQALTMMMSGSDSWVDWVQWLALVGLALAIFSGARMLHFGREASAFAACLFVLLPQPLLQSTTTQNDLIEAFFYTTAALFILRSLRDGSYGDMSIGAMAIALAVGTKGTAFVAAVALVVLVAAALIAYRPSARLIGFAVVLIVLSVVVLGSYNYILNVHNRGDISGGLQSLTAVTGARLPNMFLVLGGFADSPGVGIEWLNRSLSWSTLHVTELVAPSVGPISLDTSVQEDASSFGLIGFLVLPCVLLLAVAGRKQTSDRRVLAAAVILYLLVFAATVASNPWLGRLLIPAVALAAPLFALLAERPAIAGATLVLAVLSLVPSLLENSQKPLLVNAGAPNVFELDRRTQMTISRPEVLGVLNALDTHVGPTGTIVFVGGEDSWDYPFFGSHRERRVVRFDKPAEITYALLRRENATGAVFANVGTPPSRLTAISLGPDYWWVPVRR